MTIKRKAPSAVKKVSFAEKVAEAHLILNSIDNHIALMDTERVSLDHTKQQLEVTNMAEIKAKVANADNICKKLSDSYKLEEGNECKAAKTIACDAIKSVKNAIAEHNGNIDGFNTNYVMLADFNEFYKTVDITGANFTKVDGAHLECN